MEKTIQITIGGTTFSLTESAYNKLSAYLETLRAHFAAESESAEIMRDIEARVAEKLFEKSKGVVTEQEIAEVIAEIGEAASFNDGAEEVHNSAGWAKKRLYRNMDDAYLGGVCSGIAAYIGVDALWVRLVFLASIFFGGSGVVLYLILWFLVPEAKSAGQKLEMHGRAVNFESIAQIVKDRVDEAEKSGVFTRTARVINSFISTVFGTAGRIVGFFLTIGSVIAIVGLTTLLGIVLANWNAPYNDFPLRHIIDWRLLGAELLVGYGVLVLPALLVSVLGVRLFLKRSLLSSTATLGLIGLWILAVIAAAVMGTTIAGQYFEHIRTSPEFKQETRGIETDAFSSLSVHDEFVTVTSGDVQKVEIHGRPGAEDFFDVQVVDGVLIVTEINGYRKVCIFCANELPTITITTPDLDTVQLDNASVHFDNYIDTAIAFEIRDGVVRGDIVTGTLLVNAEDALLDLDGSATTADFIVEDSQVYAPSFMIKNATVRAENANVELNVSGEFEVAENNDSRVINRAKKVSPEQPEEM